jgi:catechol 2,3-dioxygenase-like lactoylglutathione lyase family enzyme
MTVNLADFPVGPAIAVTDMERARGFYEGKLGLRGTEAGDGGCDYECGEGTSLHVFPSPAFTGPSGATLLGWAVDDLEAAVDDLTARGVEFMRYDEPDFKTDAKGILSGAVAWMQDPDGNLISLNQR